MIRVQTHDRFFLWVAAPLILQPLSVRLPWQPKPVKERAPYAPLSSSVPRRVGRPPGSTGVPRLWMKLRAHVAPWRAKLQERLRPNL
jgi:hypothetical protein